MRTYPFIHAGQFRPLRPSDHQAFTPHNPNAKLRRRLFAAGLSTAALLAFIYSVSFSAKPISFPPDRRITLISPIEYRYSPPGTSDDCLVVFSPDEERCE